VSEQGTQRTTTPAVTGQNEETPDLGSFVLGVGRRVAHFRALGSIPHCPEWREYVGDVKHRLGEFLSPLLTEACELAELYRQDLAIYGCATPADAWRLLEQVQADYARHGGTIEILKCSDGSPLRFSTAGAYYYLSSTRIGLALPADPAKDAAALPALIGSALSVWLRPDHSACCQCVDAWRLYNGINEIIGKAFSKVWLVGPVSRDRVAAARQRAFELRQALGITGEAQPADVWRLLKSLGEIVRLRRGDVDGGRVLHWQDRPKSITLPQSLVSEEAEAAELLLLLGFALCAGPEQGFDYSLEAMEQNERLTHPVAEAFAETFRMGEPPQDCA
jgi:hypothetical protein